VIAAVVVGTLAIVAVTIAIGLAIDRRGAVMPRAQAPDATRAPAFRAGEAPATAIRAGGRQLARLRATQRCASCRAPMIAGADDRVRFGDRELTVIGFHCAACGARRSLYLEVPG